MDASIGTLRPLADRSDCKHLLATKLRHGTLSYCLKSTAFAGLASETVAERLTVAARAPWLTV